MGEIQTVEKELVMFRGEGLIEASVHKEKQLYMIKLGNKQKHAGKKQGASVKIPSGMLSEAKQ
jgi:hypothetical protein